VARTGENTKEVIDRVKEKIREIEPGLPAGVHVVPFYDRSELIEATVGTLRHALIEEILLVTLAHIIFLMHFRSILIVTLPFAACGGLLLSPDALHACDFERDVACGNCDSHRVLVDAGIVVTETPSGTLKESTRTTVERFWMCFASDETRRPSDLFLDGRHCSCFRAVFALTGQEGKLFHPLAFAKTFAMASATAIALTLTPILCTLLLGGSSIPKIGIRSCVFCNGSIVQYCPGARPPANHNGSRAGVLRGAVVLAAGIAASSCHLSTKATSCSCPSPMPAFRSRKTPTTRRGKTKS